MPDLLLGPIVRRVGLDTAVIWVETDAACEVEVLGHHAPTFHVEGHHYALVHVEGLTPGSETPYEVALDGRRCWPPENHDLPPCSIRTWTRGAPFRLLFGSCHQAAPQREPWDEPRRRDRHGIGPDALRAYALAMQEGVQPYPDVLLLVGDQVYADETHPEVEAALERRRGHPPRSGWPQVTSFEEYTWLYQLSWSAPTIRWLFSCVPVAMIFDDHDVIDDWNTSAAWRQKMDGVPWWPGRIRGGLISYWLYQHLGNVAGEEEHDERLLAEVRAAEDESAVLEAFAHRADRGTAGGEGHRWSYRIDVGPCRVVMIDARNGRVLEEGRRAMVDDDEWAWIEESVEADVDHLVIGSSLPWLLPPAVHDLEAWDEEVTAGRLGRRAIRWGEWLRQTLDLEHWAAFGRSFRGLGDLLGRIARDQRDGRPATISVVSGDVHFGYVAEPRWPDARARTYQLVSSPIRQGVPTVEQRLMRQMLRRPVTLAARGLTRLTPQARAPFAWDLTDGPWFDNNVAMLTYHDQTARLQIYRAELARGDHPTLEVVADRPL